MNAIHEWTLKALWHCRKDTFTVEVSRHLGPDDFGRGPYRWCVYAYIYPAHPLFAALNAKGDIYQDCILAMPLHGGPIGNASFFQAHFGEDQKITSFQIGADYDHVDDKRFTWMESEEDAAEVFRDACLLVDHLLHIGVAA